MTSYILSLCVVATFAIVSGTDYCSKKYCGNGIKHIACGHSSKFHASCPADAKMVDINDTLKKVLVHAHNTKRNFIAGGGDRKHAPACRMATMQWDDELAKNAALNVKQCAMAHDKCRNTDSFKYSGQNLAWMGFYGEINDAEKLKDAVNMWYSEVKYSKNSNIKSFPGFNGGPTIGHFTVMMADRNTHVGCAAATYTVPNESYKAYLVACNYATTNMINQPIYTLCPQPAINCKTSRNPEFPNLCSASEYYDVNNFF